MKGGWATYLTAWVPHKPKQRDSSLVLVSLIKRVRVQVGSINLRMSMIPDRINNICQGIVQPVYK